MLGNRSFDHVLGYLKESGRGDVDGIGDAAWRSAHTNPGRGGGWIRTRCENSSFPILPTSATRSPFKSVLRPAARGQCGGLFRAMNGLRFPPRTLHSLWGTTARMMCLGVVVLILTQCKSASPWALATDPATRSQWTPAEESLSQLGNPSRGARLAAYFPWFPVPSPWNSFEATRSSSRRQKNGEQATMSLVLRRPEGLQLNAGPSALRSARRRRTRTSIRSDGSGPVLT